MPVGVYSGFSEAAGLGGKAAFQRSDRIDQRPIVGDVEHCVEALVAFIGAATTGSPTWSPRAQCLSPSWMTPSLERFATEVVPGVLVAFA